MQELRDYCKKIKISQGGTKQELIQRIKENAQIHDDAAKNPFLEAKNDAGQTPPALSLKPKSLSDFDFSVLESRPNPKKTPQVCFFSRAPSLFSIFAWL